jgi:hypothetical protein
MVDALEKVVRRGGVVTLASAASVSSGALTVPVYEIYKVGKAPFWLPGLDLLGRFGLSTIVVPHFNNAEGGTHDTSCCYVGRVRLDLLRSERPDLPVLGVDEHTALVIDPATGRGRVHGQSQVHVLRGDEHLSWDTGSEIDLAALLRPVDVVTAGPAAAPSSASEAAAAAATSLQRAVQAHDAAAVVEALVELLPGDAQAEHALLAELQLPLADGWRDQVEPYVALLLSIRQQARQDKNWALSDQIRDGLAAIGCHVEDTPDGVRVTR